MVEDFAFSEVVRKLANLIRLGKIAEIKKNLVKVKIGRVTTGWLPIVSQAGNTNVWTPISKDEQVVVFAPYGEFAQAFVLRSINYDNFETPDELEEFNFSTDSDVRVYGSGDCNVSFDYKLEAEAEGIELFSSDDIRITGTNGVSISSPKASIELGYNSITLKSGDASINLSNSGITLSCGASSIDISSGNISLNSGSISTMPPVCKCTGGL